MRRAGARHDSRGRPPAAARVRRLRHHSLSEPAPGGGLRPRAPRRILLCRRAIEPRRGFWTVPAGFMENGETLQQAAARESYEEALAEVSDRLVARGRARAARPSGARVFPRHSSRAALRRGGRESGSEPGQPEDIPWQDLAFPSTEFALRRYLEDQAAGLGCAPLHLGGAARAARARSLISRAPRGHGTIAAVAP